MSHMYLNLFSKQVSTEDLSRKGEVSKVRSPIDKDRGLFSSSPFGERVDPALSLSKE